MPETSEIRARYYLLEHFIGTTYSSDSSAEEIPYAQDVVCKRFVDAHPDGASTEAVAEALGMTVDEVEATLQRVYAKIWLGFAHAS